MPPIPPVPILCSALTKAGNPCNFAARRHSGLCINHDPAYRDQQRQNSLRGAASSVASRQSPSLHAGAIDLSSRLHIQALLDAVIRLELSGLIPQARSRTLVRALSLAIRNFPPTSDQQRRHGRPASHEPGAYQLARTLIDRALSSSFQQPPSQDPAQQ